MENKFHINMKDGTVGACGATKGKCPFGTDEQHFTSMVAAAKAYEETQKSETIVSLKKGKKTQPAALGEFEVPDNYLADKAGLDYSENRELNALSELNRERYWVARDAGGPAVTHDHAKRIVEDLQDVLERNFPQLSWAAAIHDGTANTYDKMVKFVDEANVGVPYHYPHKTSGELTADLYANTKELVLASRPHGFPEDEMTQYNMDKRESQQLRAIAEFTGRKPDEIRTEMIASVPVKRNGLENLDDKQLQADVEKLNSLKRLSDDRKRQRTAYNRELAIRQILASPDDDKITWEILRSHDVTRNEVTSLIGRELNREQN